jgi:hypothetical protein
VRKILSAAYIKYVSDKILTTTPCRNEVLVFYWQDSQSGLSIEHIFGAGSGTLAATAFNSPPLPVDFSAAVAPKERR